MCFKLGNGVSQSEHEGKLLGIPSISTSCLHNERCLARMKNGEAVCSHCFAMHLMEFRKALRDAMERNLEALSDHLFSDEELEGVTIHFTPKMLELNPNHYVRIESFGDVRNVIQARNYLRIAKANPWLKWGAWTKNDDLYGEAFELEGKPENLSMGYSSLKLNEIADITKLDQRFVENLDFVFTVFTKEYAEEHGILINCGGRACRTCGTCYEANKSDGIKYINELLK